ncbi:hypothetical protein COD67_19015 [Bacillus cereus]|nr:hypothetical protein COI89_13405 [Bacillus cereus]PGU64233.1 hypothetical protein COD67_19015 [Bacillus cereus]
MLFISKNLVLAAKPTSYQSNSEIGFYEGGHNFDNGIDDKDDNSPTSPHTEESGHTTDLSENKGQGITKLPQTGDQGRFATLFLGLVCIIFAFLLVKKRDNIKNYV